MNIPVLSETSVTRLADYLAIYHNDIGQIP